MKEGQGRDEGMDVQREKGQGVAPECRAGNEQVGDAVVLYRNEDGAVDVIAHPPVVVISREIVEAPPSYCEVDGNGFKIHAANGTFRYRLFDLDPLTDRYTARYIGTAEDGRLADEGWDRYRDATADPRDRYRDGER